MGLSEEDGNVVAFVEHANNVVEEKSRMRMCNILFVMRLCSTVFCPSVCCFVFLFCVALFPSRPLRSSCEERREILHSCVVVEK